MSTQKSIYIFQKTLLTLNENLQLSALLKSDRKLSVAIVGLSVSPI